jgi:large subunit ribosomal protein L24
MPSKYKPVVKSKIKIKRNDQVIVIAGKSKGKKGRVLRVIADKNRIIVEGAGMIKKHMKPNPQQNIKGGILEQEAAIHISNVMLLDADGKVAKSNGVTIAEPKK